MAIELELATAGEGKAEVKLHRERRKCLLLKMLGEYIDNSIRIVCTVVLADLIQRSFSSLLECIRNPESYLPEQRIWTILRRSYTYNNRHIYLILIFAFLGMSRFGATGDWRAILPTTMFLCHMPLYWLFNGLGQSTLDYANWIRDSHGLDYASGMASSYFHGYLNLALPDRQQDGLKERIRVYEDKNNVTFGIQKLIILIPDEMWVKGIIDSELLEKVEPLEAIKINRAGVEGRPFKVGVYRLNRKINGKYYYFALEGATPMLSFYESIESHTSGTWQMREMKRELWLKFYRHLKKLLKNFPETRGEVLPIVYNSHDENGERVDVGNIIIAQMENLYKNKKID